MGGVPQRLRPSKISEEDAGALTALIEDLPLDGSARNPTLGHWVEVEGFVEFSG